MDNKPSRARRVWKYIVTALAILGAMNLLFSVSMVLVWTTKGKPPVPEKTILELDLEAGVVEQTPDDPLASLVQKDKPRLWALVQALKRAGDDERVAGLVVRIGTGNMGFATVQELRDAIARFRKRGKFAVAWADTFGEGSSGLRAYYLATAFEKIYLQPSGDLDLTGLSGETVFFKEMLDRLKIKPRVARRHEYKNALNMLTENGYTPAHREATGVMLRSLLDQTVRDMAKARKLSSPKLRQLLDRGVLLGPEAKRAGLVDGLAYRDEINARVKKRGGKGAKLLYLSAYYGRAGSPYSEGKTIALVYAVGPIYRQANRQSPLSGGMDTGGVARALRAATRDKEVSAIIFRINSPGGSVVASDTIWREVMRARDKGKPVIASMGNVAASGGYYIAMPATKIVAQPATLTGSIGVIGAKLVFTEPFWSRLGISWDRLPTTKNADLWSPIQDFTKEGWQRFQTLVDHIYDDFTARVAKARDLSAKQVNDVARGRVWTGEMARKRGLVDALGGFVRALTLAKQAAKIPAGEAVTLKTFPQKKTLFQALMAYFEQEEAESSEDHAATGQVSYALDGLEPLLRAARALGLVGPRRGHLHAVELEPFL